MQTEQKKPNKRSNGAGSKASKKNSKLEDLHSDIGFKVNQLDDFIQNLPSFILYLSSTYIMLDYYTNDMCSRYVSIAKSNPEYLEEQVGQDVEILKEMILSLNYLQKMVIEVLNIHQDYTKSIINKSYNPNYDINEEVGEILKSYLDKIEMFWVVDALDKYNDFILKDEPGLLPLGFPVNFHYSKLMSLFSIVNHSLYLKK